MQENVYHITSEYDEMQVGFYLKRVHGYSRRVLSRVKKNREAIDLNGSHIRMVDGLHTGDILRIRLYDEEKGMRESDAEAGICLEDEQVVVFNKPPFMPTHPSRFHPYDTLGNVFAAHCRKNGYDIPYRPVNRLDKDTSGAVLVAKNAYAACRLQTGVYKEYLAVVHGTPEKRQGTIDAPIGRVKEDEIKRMVRPDGQRAVTGYTTLASGGGCSLIRLVLQTGRTHQIRVHLSSIGHPLVGDVLYGGDGSLLQRQALHCGYMAFEEPETGKRITVTAPLMPDMRVLLERLGLTDGNV
ncbi:RluA family pseudouridine synthase [Candidatus Soleaferrea massiliensis]|uniref:RluA family pseudouridine synthase n=1 Tax=Candidatus Soleaferrea massiliensis TaxID=1470354 RepID=UPI00069322D5|nr:RluA family pseudouridine synthase [Candidatus Soleaferrea massiliensis]